MASLMPPTKLETRTTLQTCTTDWGRPILGNFLRLEHTYEHCVLLMFTELLVWFDRVMQGFTIMNWLLVATPVAHWWLVSCGH